jgi:hypothetical protein
MAKTYASGFDGQALTAIGGPNTLVATGKSQGARNRTWASQITLAAQPVADQIVIARPDPGQMFRGGQINISATLATSTLAVQLNKKDGTTVTLVAAATYTTANQTVDLVVTNAALGTVMDGGEIVLVIAVAALPGAGTVKTMLNFINY